MTAGHAVPARHFFADRLMTGWVEVPPDGDADWVALAGESHRFVKGRGK